MLVSRFLLFICGACHAVHFQQTLYEVASAGDIDRLKVMVGQHKQMVDTKLQGDVTALMLTAQHGHLQAVKYLLEIGASVSSVDPRGLQPIHFAAGQNRSEIVEV